MVGSTQSRIAFAPVRLQLHYLQREMIAGCSVEAIASIAGSSPQLYQRCDCELSCATHTFWASAKASSYCPRLACRSKRGYDLFRLQLSKISKLSLHPAATTIDKLPTCDADRLLYRTWLEESRLIASEKCLIAWSYCFAEKALFPSACRQRYASVTNDRLDRDRVGSRAYLECVCHGRNAPLSRTAVQTIDALKKINATIIC